MQKFQPGERLRNCELLKAALSYTRRGWLVFPLHTPNNHVCSCGRKKCASPGKHPRIAGGFKKASCDEVQVRQWWEKWPDANIGIATGLESGLFVLDIDGKEGRVSFGVLKEKGRFPNTLCALTGRSSKSGKRSAHLYYAYPPGLTLRNSVKQLGEGLDTRGAGGYVVSPPSLHVSGLLYRWKDEDVAVAELPAWLIAKLKKPSVDAIGKMKAGEFKKGQRNNALFRQAAEMRWLGKERREIARQLRTTNKLRCKPPLKIDEVLGIAENAMHLEEGPDALEIAMQQVDSEGHRHIYDMVVSLAWHLQRSRPDDNFLLPVERIGELMGCDPSLVCRYRKKATSEGWIREVDKYIAHVKATSFRYCPAKGVPPGCKSN